MAEASNPSRAEVIEYIRIKESAISQVRFVARSGGQIGDAAAANVALAFRQGSIGLIESLVSADEGDTAGGGDMTILSEQGLSLRAHLAILIDQPQTARTFFERMADEHAEGDPRFARYLLADGGDNLSDLGCALGKEWLNAAMRLYERSLRDWAVDEEPLEWAITQNNLGATLLIMGMEHTDAGEAGAMLRRSVEAFARASEVFLAHGERQDANAAIAYSNSEQAIWELLAFDSGNLVLLQDHAVAEMAITAVQTRALANGGPESVKGLDEHRRSMQIVSTRQDTGAQRLRLTRDRDFCRRPS